MSNSQALIKAAVDTGMIRRPPAELLDDARRARKDPVDHLTTTLRLPREALYRALARERKLPYAEAAELVPEADLVQRAPARLLLRRGVLPLRREGPAIVVATSDPDDAPTLDSLRAALQAPLTLVVADPQALAAAVRRHVRSTEAVAAGWDAVSYLDDLFREAWLRRASDLHLDAQHDGLRIRLRVDGALSPYGAPLTGDEALQLMSRVKVLAGLDIAERREPQDGAFTMKVDDQSFDVRVATIPTRHGERATMRLLGVETRDLTLERLGFSVDDLVRLRRTLEQPHGMLLVTGPTGSGKTTTLYAALRELATVERNIMTVEDPVEFVIPGVSQIAIDRAGKVTFARALRSLLRHDPDVLMVGEIRDEETAAVAVQAALTGHLLLASLHTNRAAGAAVRLLDLGIEPFLVADTLRAVLAQRLVRRLCPACRSSRLSAPGELAPFVGQDEAAKLAGARVHEPTGCPACLGTGYRGRLAIVEALWVDEATTEAIGRRASTDELVRLARAAGSRSLADDALHKVLAGDTSLAEAREARA